MNGNNWKKIWIIMLVLIMFLGLVAGVTADENDEEDKDEEDIKDDDDNDEDDEEEDREDDDDDESKEEDNDEDEIDDDKEDFEEREIKIHLDESEVEIKSEWKSNSLEDELKVQFESDDEIKIKFEYTTELNDTENDLEFKVSIENIIEYIDDNGNSRYDDSDIIVSTYDLKDATFNDIDYKTETALNNETVHIISTSSTDDVFGIVLYAVGTFTNLDSGSLAPSEIKIDFILNYDYVSNNSLIALKVEVKTEHKTKTDIDSYSESQGYASDESELSIVADNYLGFFSWADHASIDGIIKPVNTTVKSEVELEVENGESEFEQKDVIYFCYLRGNNIVHDPKVGVVSKSSLLAGIAPEDNGLPISIILYGLGIILAVAVVGTSTYIRYKKNNIGRK